MAKAKLTKQGNVKLTMTREEAMLVYCITGGVHGDSGKAPVKHATSVYDALYDLFGLFDKLGLEYPINLREGKMSFADYPVTEDKGN